MVEISFVGKQYTLKADNGDMAILSESEIISLAQSAGLMMDHILAKLQGKGSVSPRPTIDVGQFVLNSDVHQTAVVLEMVDTNGNKTGFAVQLELAAELSQDLAKLVSKLQENASDRKVQ